MSSFQGRWGEKKQEGGEPGENTNWQKYIENRPTCELLADGYIDWGGFHKGGFADRI